MKKRVKNIILIVIDLVIINLSLYLAFYLRFEGNIPSEWLQRYFNSIVIFSVVKITIFYFLNLYKSLWEYASIEELIQILLAITLSSIITLGCLLLTGLNFTKSIYILIIILDILLVGFSRFIYRIYKRMKSNYFRAKDSKRILIIGAGDAGASLIKEIRNNVKLRYKPIAIIDDDIAKWGKRINGVPVLGGRKDIEKVADKEKVSEIIIAIPSANKGDIREIVNECNKTKCKLKIIPGMSAVIEGKVNIDAIREIDIEDLLGRDQVSLDIDKICGYLGEKKVLVTGGGGSIGSELCRQIARFSPEALYILDIYENNAYELYVELKKQYKELKLQIIIASIRDRERIFQVIKDTAPDVIFHAAAHKHVPLMEENPKEAIKNNVFGTLNLVQAANQCGIGRFVIISTDKAVNPTNIMGASKRLCEILVQSINLISQTDFVAVRFGNVLESNGSVIPVFKRQIKEGGPVTVTHRDVTRYFMTISEATQLVLEAGAIAMGGEIFILDMGEPVKIIHLAEDLIRLSGLEPYNDIPIEIVGLRPGEKLFEELLLDEEKVISTNNEKIFVEKAMFHDYEILLEELKSLKETLDNGSNEELKKKAMMMIRKNITVKGKKV